ncbi:Na+/H+ antiporter NhaA [Nocardioides zeae]|uniref:Na(+)/H(+) antiporter NhaA n=1 Tax=Nocardioides imazamoxiresistens TaxID=3231893 RepID=A0ABU3PVV6_9ACTN|nr:Na+/H+ antiporter NhaA [Nocardioides zeae]MDT9593373.1 Na+/H+ antiporter NhaA [Nocardioides zeae]
MGRVSGWARRETTGGLLLLVATTIALLWANSPWREAYADLGAITLGPASLHLDLSLSTWAADAVLAVFFFVVGLELKHELVIGSLRNPKEAAVPVLAAAGGVVVPSLIYVLVVVGSGDVGHRDGWAIPAATDIAFALAVLAVFGKGLPVALRVFLLTLAVVDDLIAISIIALFYTSDLAPLWLLPAIALIGLFGFLSRRRRVPVVALVPIAVVAWVLVHESGVHATVAGVLLGLVVPAVTLHGESAGRAHRYAEAFNPWSSALALPVFAFFAAGVTIIEDGGPLALLSEEVALGVLGGLVVGKVVGVLGTTALVVRLTPFRLPQGIGVRDLLPVGVLTGIGFTVALLIAELSFSDDHFVEAGKAGVLLASVLCAVAGATLLRWDARQARHRDMNLDGVDDGDVPLM